MACGLLVGQDNVIRITFIFRALFRHDHVYQPKSGYIGGFEWSLYRVRWVGELGAEEKWYLLETARSCGMEGMLRYEVDTGNRRRPVYLVHNSDGLQFGSNFYSAVCWIAPLEFAIGLGAAEWSGTGRYPWKEASRCELGQMMVYVEDTD